ncbi:hypothetical protein HU200_003900 [Digitaria exilis]|uniref:Uncharacterized protein n=1 Tax=Digitaria exilis TaxID=1010633 RepID=A0A835KSS1_9POAL|nr:hypothetical protein HU200_003900 [Digitaria exilis]
MLNFSQPSASSSPFGFYDPGQGASSSSRGRSHGCRSQDKEQRNPGEEPDQGAQGVDEGEGGDGYARMLSEHLSETVTRPTGRWPP